MNEKVFFLSLVIITTVKCMSYSSTYYTEWEAFKMKYDKTYSTPEEDRTRLAIYMYNRELIARHNRNYEYGLETFTMAINQFGDLTNHEFIFTKNGFNRTSHTRKTRTSSLHFKNGLEYLKPEFLCLPSEFDWRTKGAVTPVKNQLDCGSCWAFSTTGALEGQQFRKTGKLISLSEQNLVDCSGAYGNDGCSGGLMDNAFIYIERNDGLDTEKSYPYEGKDNNCRYKIQNKGATDAGFVKIPQGDESQLLAAVASVGPISVAIDASNIAFQFYSEGVYYKKSCSSTFLDHAVLVVGYGVDHQTKQSYWLVKNSWGTDWGEKGYIRMSRNKNNNCGIATSASYPIVK